MKTLSSKQYTAGSKGVIMAFFVLVLTTYFLLPTAVLAQEEYKLLTPLPGISTDGETTTANTYIPGIIQLIIGLAGVLAVIKIFFGGILYMSTDAVQGKSDGKKHITDALWGLFLIISAWIILYTLNPRLLKFDFTIEQRELGGAFEDDLGKTGPNSDDRDADKENFGCPNCIPIFGTISESIGTTPPKTQSENGCGPTETGLCYLHSDLIVKLQSLTESINSMNDENRFRNPRAEFTWRVNELIPPSTQHAHLCHAINTPVTGKCTDVSIGGLQCTNTNTCNPTLLNYDALKIGGFMKAAKDAGLHVVYEVPENMGPRAQALSREVNEIYEDDLGFAATVIAIPITHEHFSVYESRSVYDTR